MRVFLKSKRTGRYYSEASQPGTESGVARDFGTVRAATDFALAQQLQEMQIALRWDSWQHEILLPVLPEWRELEAKRAAAGQQPDRDRSAPVALPDHSFARQQKKAA
jgi:hypothetical protein